MDKLMSQYWQVYKTSKSKYLKDFIADFCGSRFVVVHEKVVTSLNIKSAAMLGGKLQLSFA